jgi:hypothetical protein
MANNPNEISPEEADAIKDYVNKHGLMSGSQNTSTSDEALPIADVVNCSSCKYQMSGTTEPCRSCILFSNHTPK